MTGLRITDELVVAPSNIAAVRVAEPDAWNGAYGWRVQILPVMASEWVTIHRCGVGYVCDPKHEMEARVVARKIAEALT